MASKKETFMQGVVTVMFSQILIKILLKGVGNSFSILSLVSQPQNL